MKLLLVLALAISMHYTVNAQSCSYQYQIPITITNNGSSTLTNYQVSFTVNTADPIGAGKMQADGSDISFTDANNNPLYYWIESGLSSTSTVFWVKVGSIGHPGTTTIYMNYGKTPSANYNSGANTFLFFDDFTGTTLSTTKWSHDLAFGSTITVNNGITFSGSGPVDIVTQSSFPSASVTEANVVSISSHFGGLFELNSGSNSGVGMVNYTGGTSGMYLYSSNNGCGTYSVNHQYDAQLTSNLTGTWSVQRNSDNTTGSWPGGTVSTNNGVTVTSTVQPALGITCGGTGSMQVSWVRVRQYYAAGTTQSVGPETVSNIVSALAMFNESYISTDPTQTTNTVYGTCGNLIALVNTTGGTASGQTTAKVWIETTQPTQYVRRHFEIEPNTNGTATVTLYFTQADFDAFNAINTTKLPTGPNDLAGKGHLYIEKRPGTSSNGTGLPGTYAGTPITIQPALGNIVWNTSQSRWEITFAVPSFSGFFVKSTSTTLPLTLLNFTGSKQSNGSVALQWQTANEENLHQYQVQQGTAPGSFATIGQVTPQNSHGPNTYTFTDNTPWTGGERYYRLLTVENDGSVSYSTIVALGNTNGNSQVTVYPNPARDMVTVVAGDPSILHTTAVLCDVTGRVVRKLQLDNLYTQVTVSGLNPGIYILSFSNGSSVRILKQ